MQSEKIGSVTICTGDCLEVLPHISGVSGVLTDPPYGLSFMGKAWDKGVPGIPFWEAISAACLPGAHLLAFGGTRTYHRQTCAIEDAGWTVRDCLMWVYGSGFPKSLDISKAIDKAAEVEREVFGANPNLKGRTRPNGNAVRFPLGHVANITKPATANANTWQGYGTALKPALEPIVLAQKPRQGSFVDNVTAHGCGALNVDGCRVEAGTEHHRTHQPSNCAREVYARQSDFTPTNAEGGRWPSNLLIDGSDEVVRCFPETMSGSGARSPNGSRSVAMSHKGPCLTAYNGSSGSAARFFYCAKASRSEREAGCADVPPLKRDTSREEGAVGGDNPRNRGAKPIHNSHPTVKPIALMRYLLRLITQPEHNLILDPFAGSGTTGIACALAGVPCVLIEKDPHHVEIIKARIKWAANIRQLLGREPELDLTPYQSKPEPKSKDQGSLF